MERGAWQNADENDKLMLYYVARGGIEGWCDRISSKVKLGGLDPNNVPHTEAWDMKY